MLKRANFNSLSQFELDYFKYTLFCIVACLKAHIEALCLNALVKVITDSYSWIDNT